MADPTAGGQMGEFVAASALAAMQAFRTRFAEKRDALATAFERLGGTGAELVEGREGFQQIAEQAGELPGRVADAAAAVLPVGEGLDEAESVLERVEALAAALGPLAVTLEASASEVSSTAAETFLALRAALRDRTGSAHDALDELHQAVQPLAGALEGRVEDVGSNTEALLRSLGEEASAATEQLVEETTQELDTLFRSSIEEALEALESEAPEVLGAAVERIRGTSEEAVGAFQEIVESLQEIVGEDAVEELADVLRERPEDLLERLDEDLEGLDPVVGAVSETAEPAMGVIRTALEALQTMGTQGQAIRTAKEELRTRIFQGKASLEERTDAVLEAGTDVRERAESLVARIQTWVQRDQAGMTALVAQGATTLAAIEGLTTANERTAQVAEQALATVNGRVEEVGATAAETLQAIATRARELDAATRQHGETAYTACGSVDASARELVGTAQQHQGRVGGVVTGLTTKIRDEHAQREQTVSDDMRAWLDTTPVQSLQDFHEKFRTAAEQSLESLRTLTKNLGEEMQNEARDLLEDLETEAIERGRDEIEDVFRDALDRAVRAVVDVVAEELGLATVGTTVSSAISPYYPQLLVCYHATGMIREAKRIASLGLL